MFSGGENEDRSHEPGRTESQTAVANGPINRQDSPRSSVTATHSILYMRAEGSRQKQTAPSKSTELGGVYRAVTGDSAEFQNLDPTNFRIDSEADTEPYLAESIIYDHKEEENVPKQPPAAATDAGMRAITRPARILFAEDSSWIGYAPEELELVQKDNTIFLYPITTEKEKSLFDFWGNSVLHGSPKYFEFHL